jgi:hypothetical protein
MEKKKSWQAKLTHDEATSLHVFLFNRAMEGLIEYAYQVSEQAVYRHMKKKQ